MIINTSKLFLRLKELSGLQKIPVALVALLTLSGCLGGGGNHGASGSGSSADASPQADEVPVSLSVEITSPASGGYVNATNASAYPVSGTCTERDGPVTVSSGTTTATATCSTNRTWSTSINLSSFSDGATVTLTATHSSIYGNPTTQDSVSITKDSTAPAAATTVSLNTPASSPGNNKTPIITVSGGGVASGMTVSLYTDSSCTVVGLKASGVASSTSINLTSSTLSDGTYNFYANVTDPAGNVSTCSTATAAYVLDATPPAVPTSLALNTPASSPNTNTTPTITISGGGVASGVVVKMYSNSTCTTLQASGTAGGASINLTTAALTDGTYNFYATAADSLGNTSSCSTATVQYVVDTTAPTVAITSPAANSYINNSTKSAFAISGTCSDNGRTVTVVAGGTVSATPTCTSGAWSSTMDLSSLSDGTVTVTADLTDAAGNAATQSSRNFTKDVVAPSTPTSLALNSPATSPGNDSTPTVTVSGGGVANGVTVAMYSDSSCTTQVATGSATTTSIDLTTSTLTDNTYNFYAKATDAAGNASSCSTATVQYVLDTVAPSTPTSLTLNTPATSPGTNATPIITVSGGGIANGVTVKMFTNNTCTTQVASGTATSTSINLTSSSLTSGTYNFYATAADSVGNTSSCSTATVQYVLTSTAPSAPTSLVLNSPTTSPGNDTTPTITVSGGSVINGNTVSLFTDSSCSTQVATGTATTTNINLTSSVLAEGTYNFYANVTDTSSNTSTCSTATVQYVVDTTAPATPTTLALNSPATSPGSDTTPTVTVSGGGVASGITVKMFMDSSCAIQVASGSATGTSIDLTTSALSDNTYNFYATATDAAGNASTCSTATVQYVLDTVAPSAPTSLTLNSPATSPGNDTTPTITVSGGGVASGITVTMYTDNTCSTQVATGSATGTSIDLTSSALTDATYNFYAKATDGAGNASSCSTATVQYVLDTVAPSAPTVLALSSPATSPNTDTTPTITVSGGGVASGITVKMYSNNTCTTQVASGSATGTSIDLTSSALTDNTYDFYATATDAAGNASSCSTATVQYVLDTTSPSAPASLALNSPATSPGNDTTPTITVSGSGVANGITVKMYTDNTCTTQVASGSATTTSIDLTSSALTDATYNFYATAEDALGNKSSCSTATVQYVLDTVAPSAPTTLTLNTPASSPGNNTTPTIAVSGGGVASGITVALFTDNTCSTQVATSSATGTSINLTSSALTDATYNFYAKATDAAGNASSCSTATVQYVLDTSTPTAPTTIALSSPASSPANDTTPTVTVSGGSVANGVTVRLFTDNTCSTQVASGTATSTSINLTSSVLTEGTYNFYANLTNTSSNTSTCSTATVQYVLDTTPPSSPTTLTLNSPASSPGNDTTPTITVSGGGVASGIVIGLYADSSCTLPTQKASAAASGTSIDLTSVALSTDGTYNFYANATDSVGNASTCSTATVQYVLDTTPPSTPTSLTLNNPASSPGTVSTPTITVSGGGVANGVTVKLFTDSSCSTQVASGSATSTSINLTSSALAEATYTFYANAADSLGNTSTCSTANVSYQYDASAPTVTGLSNDTTPTKSKSWTWGCSKVGCTYLFVVDQVSNTAPTGSWVSTTTTSQGSGDATYYLHVQAKDTAGNLSAVVHVSAILDNTAPTAPSSVNDGQYKNSLSTAPAISWNASTDTNGIDHYEYAIGTTAGATDILTWTSGTSSPTITPSGLSLTTNTTYYATIRAVDAAGNTSTAGNGDGWIADTTLPGAPTGVSLGSVPNSLTTSPTVSWTAPSDTSGIGSYDVQVYKASDNSVVQAWQTSTSGSALTGLSLTNGVSYYVKVRATDNAGNIGTSYGQSSNWTASLACTPGSQTFSYTGSSQSFVVPTGCTTITAKLWGAGGGGDSTFYGGGGGFVKIDLTVTSGETLSVIVGGGGASITGDTRSANGGGGRSAIQRSSADIATAGGGGGSSKSNRGGAGGANTGEDGVMSSGTGSGGGGGTQSAGGAGGTGAVNGGAGSQYTGGYCDTTAFGGSSSGSSAYGGGGAPWTLSSGTRNVGGSGGGGYYGGGSGSSRTIAQGGGTGGGGGSNYGPGATTNSQAATDGSGAAAGTGDPDYSAGIGAGGQGANGGNGKVVISY